MSDVIEEDFEGENWGDCKGKRRTMTTTEIIDENIFLESTASPAIL